MANLITTVFNFSERGNGLKKIKSDVLEAQGATAKLSAGWAGAKQSIVANAGSIATVAGGALIAFGAKAVQGFTDGALAAGKFAEATGVSTEAASKWISAAGDIGIQGDLVQKAFQKANKEIAEGGGVLDEYGISVVRAADGTVDANETFLRTIDIVNGIQDPTEKARVAQELFGRSYGEIAELIFQDADKVRAALESTSEQQVFDEEEVQKAREYREAMDRLADSAQDVALVVGEALVPVLSDIATAVADIDAVLDDLGDYDIDLGGDSSLFGEIRNGLEGVINPWNRVKEISGEWNELVGNGTDETEDLAEATEHLNAALELGEGNLGSAARSAEDLADAEAEAADAARELGRAHEEAGVKGAAALREANELADEFGDFGGEIGGILGPTAELGVAFDDLGDAIGGAGDELSDVLSVYDELRGRLKEEDIFDRIADQLNEVKANPNDRDETRRLLGLVLDLGEAYDDIPQETITRIYAQIDEGSIDAAIAELIRLTEGRSVNLNLGTSSRFVVDPINNGAPIRIDTPTVSASPAPTVINQYPVTPSPLVSNMLQQSFAFGNGYRS